MVLLQHYLDCHATYIQLSALLLLQSHILHYTKSSSILKITQAIFFIKLPVWLKIL